MFHLWGRMGPPHGGPLVTTPAAASGQVELAW